MAHRWRKRSKGLDENKGACECNTVGSIGQHFARQHWGGGLMHHPMRLGQRLVCHALRKLKRKKGPQHLDCTGANQLVSQKQSKNAK